MPTSVIPPVVDPEAPTWKSPNELIHERINFDDTIWGFGLAGGAYYKTPLRITYVRPGSRAQMAHIYPGDVVLKINGIDSSTLTLEEAHRMIVESGIHLKINVTSPEDIEDNYYCYQDPLEVPLSEELKPNEVNLKGISRYPKVLGKEDLRERKNLLRLRLYNFRALAMDSEEFQRNYHVSKDISEYFNICRDVAECSHWSLQWPWKCKRRTIWKESNCYLVPSKYEEKYKSSRNPEIKEGDMIVLDNFRSVKKKNAAEKNENKNNNIDSGETTEGLPNDNICMNDGDDIKEQHSSIDKNKVGSIIEQNISANKNEKGNTTEQISSIDNNINDGAKEQNISIDTNNRNESAELNTSADNNNEVIVAEPNNSPDENNEDIVAEPNNSADENNEDIVAKPNNSADENNEDIVAEQNISADKTNEDIVAEQNNSANKNNKHIDAEHNNSADKNNKDIVAEQNNSEDKCDNGVSENNTLVNKNDEVEQEQNSSEDKKNGNNVMFENGDIPDMSETEKLTHNSR